VLVLGAYLAVVAAATLLWAPVPIGLSFSERLDAMLRPQIRGGDLIDAVRNVTLFSGWGLLWVLSAPRSWTFLRVLGVATLSGAFCSLSIELGQLFLTERTPSLLDVATNSLGAALGVVVMAAFLNWLEKHVGARSFVGMPAALFAMSYGGAVLGETLTPLFRQALAPNAWGGPARRWAAVMSRYRFAQGWTPLPWGDFLLFAPLGVFAVAALSERGLAARRAGWIVAVLGVLFAFVLEFAHGLLGVNVRLGAALLHAVAICLGAAVAAVGLPRFSKAFRGSARPRLVIASYTIVIGLWILRPYRLALDALSIRMKLSFPWWIPLGDARYRTDLFTVIDVFGSFLLFLPLGALLAVWPLRRWGALAGILPVAYLALSLEASQFLIAARTPTITDPLVQIAGAAIGWFAMRYVGFPRYGTVLPGHEVRPVDGHPPKG